MTTLQELNDQVLPNDEQIGVPFSESWSVQVWTPGLGCDTPGCAAPGVVVARLGDGANAYCEACWRGEGLVRFLAIITAKGGR